MIRKSVSRESGLCRSILFSVGAALLLTTSIGAARADDAQAVIAQEKSLVALGRNVATIDNKNPAMLELTDQLVVFVEHFHAGAEN